MLTFEGSQLQGPTAIIEKLQVFYFVARFNKCGIRIISRKGGGGEGR